MEIGDALVRIGYDHSLEGDYAAAGPLAEEVWPARFARDGGLILNCSSSVLAGDLDMRSPELLARLRAAAEGRAATLESEARRQVVLALVAALEPIVARIAELTSEIRGALHDHLDGPTFRSLFIDPKSAVCAAAMLAEIGDCRARYPTADALAGDAGVLPRLRLQEGWPRIDASF